MGSAQDWKALLAKQGADEPLQNVLDGLLRVCCEGRRFQHPHACACSCCCSCCCCAAVSVAAAKIAAALRGTDVRALGQQNAFGDEQLSVDLLAEQLLRSFAEKESSIRAVSSEEDTPLHECNEKGEFILCWDPLDGSSIVDCNWSVGTIVGIWRLQHHNLIWRGKETLIQQTGRQQVAALVVVYGPRTTAVIALNLEGEKKDKEEEQLRHPGTVVDLRLVDEEVALIGQPRIRAEAKIFSPANLRAAQDLPQYQQLIKYWMEKRFTLRYTGGFVPDVYQIFVKQQGVFCNPESKAAPAKLRMCFEVLPLALLVEAAGGQTSDGKRSLLSVVGMEL